MVSIHMTDTIVEAHMAATAFQEQLHAAGT
jgi:hypothetical protein